MAATAGSALDPLIGREDDLEALLALVADARLVTLTGPGGSGKTRLAHAVCAAADRLGREAWFVDCSAIQDAGQMPAAVAAAIDVTGSGGGEPHDLVVSRLRDLEAILVLDNLEQIDGAGFAVVRLIEELPRLSVVTTSRRPLGVPGESEFAVRPLALPREATAASVEASPAGMLFMTRARRPARAPLDEAMAGEIARLVDRLDGLPLAIELAAARTRTMTPREINRRLDERGLEAIDIDRGAHHSLRAIVDWTVGQLSSDDAELLDALTVCAGFDLALAEALLPGREVVASLESLVSLGLVQAAPTVAGSSRFRLLVPIQELVGRELGAVARETYAERHARHILAVAAGWQQRKGAAEIRELAELFDTEADNVRLALDHLQRSDPDSEVVLTGMLSRFWARRGRFWDGYQRFLRARGNAAEPSSALGWAAVAILGSLWIAIPWAELVALEDWIAETARTLGDTVLLEEGLRQRAMAASSVEDAERLESIDAELQRVPHTDDPGSQLRRLHIAMLVERVRAGHRSARFLELQQRVYGAMKAAGDELALGTATDLAGTHFLRGEFDEAVRIAGEASDGFAELGREEYAAWAQAWRVAALAELGSTAEAVDGLGALVTMAGHVRHLENISNVLWAGMAVALASGAPELAARCYGALVRGLQQRHGYVLSANDAAKVEEWLQRARRLTTEVSIELALRDGERDSPADLVEALPALLERATAGSGGAASRTVVRHGELTRREVEILRLVGLGRADPEIAAELYISPKTASVHVSNIKGKLGVESRLEMALRARELGLVNSSNGGRTGSDRT